MVTGSFYSDRSTVVVGLAVLEHRACRTLRQGRGTSAGPPQDRPGAGRRRRARRRGVGSLFERAGSSLFGDPPSDAAALFWGGGID